VSPWREREAPAKLNLGLRILGRRPDGFHELESVFVPLELRDLLRGRPAGADSFACDDPALPAGADNLVCRAREAWRREAREAGLPGTDRPVALRLEKQIPSGAGLGGGSSDAAACLLLLNELNPPGLDFSALRRCALTLGSDVPFFLQPCWAHVTGRGEVVTPIDPVFADVVVLVWPGLHVSTAWAYSLLSASLTKQGRYASFQGSCGFVNGRGDPASWPGNDFEAVVFPEYPALEQAKSRLRAAGARHAAMTGSGSAIYGLFDSAQSAMCFVQQHRSMFPVVLLTRPRAGVSPAGGGGKGHHENHRSEREPPG